MTTRTRLMRIGNSWAIRLPKTVAARCRLDEPLKLEVQGNHLVVRSVAHPRMGWDEAFRMMHHRGDDRLLDGDHHVTSRWDRVRWDW